MLLAAIGDCLGHVHAARAVLEDIADRGILTVLNTGNAVTGYPWPQETADLLTEHGVRSAQGMLDRAAVRTLRRKQAADGPDIDSAAFAFRGLSSATVEAIRVWPVSPRLTLENIEMIWFSGTPSSQRERLDPNGSVMRYQRVREAVNVPLIICGGHWEPYSNWVDGALFVCPGSVGLGRTARYTIVDTDRTPWSVENIDVAYDGGDVGAALREAGLTDPVEWVYPNLASSSRGA